MAEIHTLSVKLRDEQGKRANRRLRNSGRIPAVLYGHKKEVKNLTLAADEVDAAVRNGNRFVSLSGGLSEDAFIKDVQWNTWGTAILHVDFARVSAHERMQVTVAVELRGEAPGIKDGGVVKHALHSIELECEAASVPEKISVNINNLAFNEALHVSDLELPAGAKALIDSATVVVSCIAPLEVSEEESVAAGEEEPEVIGRKKADEEE